LSREAMTQKGIIVSMPRRIWALADPHLSFAKPKPMDIFGDHWRDHPARIARNCRAVIEDDDLLLIPGDLSWALKRKDAEPDLQWLADLPGIKVLCKGNHDYWWDSDRPINHPGLHDTPFVSDDGQIGIAGTRGWYSPESKMSDQERNQCEKIIAREVSRLTKRLEAVQDCPLKIALIHYPPIVEFSPVLKRFNVQTVLYGHLHLNGMEHPLPEEWQGIRALCVAADRLHFAPRLVATL
jgi:predicted phosphohydrolase